MKPAAWRLHKPTRNPWSTFLSIHSMTIYCALLWFMCRQWVMCNTVTCSYTAGGDDVVRACRLGADGVSQTIDFSKRDAAAAGGSEFTGLQIEAGGKISAITCNPGVQGCMALTTPQLLRIFDVEASREFSSKDFQAEGGIHSMCWSPTGSTCLAALKNRTIVMHDPRASPSSSAAVFPGHAAVAPNRLAYLKGNYFCSTGKGAGQRWHLIVFFHTQQRRLHVNDY